MPSLHRRSWIATIIFFLITLGASLFVWQDCILNEKPRQAVVDEFAKSKEDFEEMSKKVKGAIGKLRERKQQFDGVGSNDSQRELFRQYEFEEEPAPERVVNENQSLTIDQEPASAEQEQVSSVQ